MGIVRVYQAQCEECKAIDEFTFRSLFAKTGWLLQKDGKCYCKHCKSIALHSLRKEQWKKKGKI